MEESIVVVRGARKTISMHVDASGKVVVRAPSACSDAEIRAFLGRHERWLEKRLNAVHPALDLTFGSHVTIFGEERLIVERGRAGLADGVLFLPAEDREAKLAHLLKKEVRIRATALVSRLAAEYGFEFGVVCVSSARTRWGSCSGKGRISFSFRTAFLSDVQMRYIAVHELCHTRVFDHSPAFWREVERIVPNWKEVRKSVRKCSYFMNYL